MFRAMIAIGAVAAAIGKAYADKVKLEEDLQENDAECDEWFVEVEFLPAVEGDLIQMKREGYAHWAVYVGDGYVIHLTQIHNGKAQIFRQQLKAVAKDSICRVNNLEIAAQRRQLTSKNVNDILDTAYDMLGEISDYHLFNDNCEHFATYCRFGTAFSEQGLAANERPIIGKVAPLFATSKYQYD